MIVAGVDPGNTGALALLDVDSYSIVAVLDPPLCRIGGGMTIDYALLVAEMRDGFERFGAPMFATVEAQSARPGMNVSAMFKLGTGFGVWLGSLSCFGVPVRLVGPAVWKRAMGLLKADKAASRALANRLFPQQTDLFARVKDHGRAEAALLSAYGARKG